MVAVHIDEVVLGSVVRQVEGCGRLREPLPDGLPSDDRFLIVQQLDGVIREEIAELFSEATAPGPVEGLHRLQQVGIRRRRGNHPQQP